MTVYFGPRPFTFGRTVHFSSLGSFWIVHFGPHSLNGTTFDGSDRQLYIYFWTVHITSSWRVHCRSIEPSTVWLLRHTLSTSTFHICWSSTFGLLYRPFLAFELSTYTLSRFRYEYRCSPYNVIKMKIHEGVYKWYLPLQFGISLWIG